jgi:hypothetical protein
MTTKLRALGINLGLVILGAYVMLKYLPATPDALTGAIGAAGAGWGGSLIVALLFSDSSN